MKTEIFAKFFKQSPRRALYWAVCVLLVLAVLTSWSVSGVYAKYVDAASADGYAGVANMGISKFELVEHEFIDISNNLAEIEKNKHQSLYILNYDSTTNSNAYSKVIPGIDIPKDPFINLELKSNEVSYELYVIVKESDGFPEYVTYKLADGWEQVKDENGNNIPGLYKYVGKKVTDEKYDIENGIFVAGKEYNVKYSVTNEEANNTDIVYTSIHILKDDKIMVSEHFNSEPDEDGSETKFSLTFTAYLQQVINKPTGSDTENGD